MSGTRSTLCCVLAFVCALACASAGTAADNYQYRPVRSDETLARASVATMADLDNETGWRGGAARPDRAGAGSLCAGHAPGRSDLVVTGAARSVFRYRDLLRLETRSEVFASGRMLQADWRRTVVEPDLVSCLRADWTANGGTVISLRPLSLPRFAAHVAGWRALVDVRTTHGPVDVVADLVLCADGRREISLAQVAVGPDAATTAGMKESEVRLARSLILRLEV